VSGTIIYSSNNTVGSSMAPRRFVNRKTRRETLWLGFATGTTTLAAASTASLIGSLNASALALRPFTVVRVRGFWHVRSDQTSALEAWGCSIGYSVVTDQAIAIGVTAVPTPEADKGSSKFFVHESMYGVLGFITGVGTQEIGNSAKYDSKAMRKVELGSDIAITLEVPAAGASSASVICGARMLIKLH